MITIGLLSSWESEGVKITSLNQEEYNYRNRIYYFVGVSCITVLYSVAMTTLGFMGIKVPSKAVSSSSSSELVGNSFVFFCLIVNIFCWSRSILLAIGSTNNECHPTGSGGFCVCPKKPPGLALPQNSCGMCINTLIWYIMVTNCLFLLCM